MKSKTGFWATLALSVIVMAGVGIYALVTRLSDQSVWVLAGGIGALVIVLGVGGLFIIKDLAQAYVMRRMLAQDDMADMRQMAMVARIMGSGGTRSPNVNLRLPPGQQMQPWQMVMPQSQVQGNGQFRDTIVADEVEIE